MALSTNGPRKTRRRRPRQARSKDTVDAILTATAQVLVTRGYSRLTTRAIAERAGVSVGSLYQYFSSKEAVIRALAEAQRIEVLTAVRSAMAGTDGSSLAERTPALIRALLEAKTRNPELNAKLSAAMLEIDGPCFLTADSEPFRELVRDTLAAHAGETRVDDPELASFVIVRALEGVLSGVAAGERRFDDPQLIQALGSLVLGLVHPSSGLTGRRPIPSARRE